MLVSKAELLVEAQTNILETVFIDYIKGNLAGLLEKSYNIITETWVNSQ